MCYRHECNIPGSQSKFRSSIWSRASGMFNFLVVFWLWVWKKVCENPNVNKKVFSKTWFYYKIKHIGLMTLNSDIMLRGVDLIISLMTRQFCAGPQQMVCSTKIRLSLATVARRNPCNSPELIIVKGTTHNGNWTCHAGNMSLFHHRLS